MKTGILLLVLGIVLLIAAVGLALYFRSHPMASHFEEAVPSPARREGVPPAPSSGTVFSGQKTEILPEEDAP